MPLLHNFVDVEVKNGHNLKHMSTQFVYYLIFTNLVIHAKYKFLFG